MDIAFSTSLLGMLAQTSRWVAVVMIAIYLWGIFVSVREHYKAKEG
jgi:hypothetical protein